MREQACRLSGNKEKRQPFWYVLCSLPPVVLLALFLPPTQFDKSQQDAGSSPGALQLGSQRPNASSLLSPSGNSDDPKPCRLNPYGGFDRRMGKATGFFHVEKIGNRWWFIDPSGNPFWMKAIYNIDPNALGGNRRLAAKYGGLGRWSNQVLKRMLAWGFNTTGEYSHNRVRPYGTYGASPPNLKVPAIAFTTPISLQSLINSRRWIPERVHDIISGVPRYTYNDYRAPLIDVYDPDYARVARKVVEELDTSITGGLAAQKWIVGVTLDDADQLWGFKGEGSGGRVTYPHPAFMVLTTNSMRKGARDPKVYSKYALRDFLRAKHGAIETLNSAWGSTYTSWDSDGGYAVGSGLLDEDGRFAKHPWVGNDPFTLSSAAAQVRADLEDFLFEFATMYFKTIHDAFRATDANHLLFGPAALGMFNNPVRETIVKAALPYVDVFQLSYDLNPLNLEDPDAALIATYERISKYEPEGKPIFVWTGQSANADSPLNRFADPWGMARAKTQEERAHIVVFMINRYLTVKGPNDDYFVVGYDFWSWGDHGGEKSNWGLVTFQDNAYDGKEAVIARGTDRWGYPSGGEASDYGDFLTSVAAANHNVYRAIGLSSTSCTAKLPPQAKKTTQ